MVWSLSAALNAYAGTQNVTGHSVAQLARLNAVWSATPNLPFTLRTEYLRAGKVLTRAGYTDSLFNGVWATFFGSEKSP